MIIGSELYTHITKALRSQSLLPVIEPEKAQDEESAVGDSEEEQDSFLDDVIGGELLHIWMPTFKQRMKIWNLVKMEQKTKRTRRKNPRNIFRITSLKLRLLLKLPN